MKHMIKSALVVGVMMAPVVAQALPSAQGGVDRQFFTVSGHIAQAANGAFSGRWMIVLRPNVPDSATLAVVCTYTGFSAFSVVGNQASFDARGTCVTLDEDGILPTTSVANHFTLTDNGAGPDGIDVNMYGANGVAVPGGLVSYGDFTVTP